MEFPRQAYWSGFPFPFPKLPYEPAIPLLGTYSEETKTGENTCTPMFTAALFTITRTWKQPRCPSTDEWIKKLWHVYTMEYYSAIKNVCIWVSSKEVDELRACYTEWSKSEKEKQISYIKAHIWNLERWYWWIYLHVGQQWRHRHREQTHGHEQGEEGEGGWTERVAWKHIHYRT